jgi:hypothetical protein
MHQNLKNYALNSLSKESVIASSWACTCSQTGLNLFANAAPPACAARMAIEA